MTLDEQIKQFEDFVKKIESVNCFNTNQKDIIANIEAIEHHKMLIAWLRELQLYRKGVAEAYHRINVLEDSVHNTLENHRPRRADGKSTSYLVTHLMMCGMVSAFDKCLEIMHQELDMTEEDIE